MPSARPHRGVITLAVCAAAALAAVALRLGVGEGGWAWPRDADVWGLRGPRVAAGLIVGAALATAGVMLQCLLRNPLASPDLLGLSSGAGLGVTLAAYAAYLAGGTIAPTSGNPPAAVAGALVALAAVYTLAQRRGRLEPVSLVLTGVMVSIICAASGMFVQHLLPDRGLAASRWMLGALDDEVTPPRLALTGGLTVLGVAVGLACARWMDLASLADDEARALGLPLTRLRVVLFVTSGVLTAAAVVLAGPVGFVGLVCPHAVRLAAGPSHRTLVLGSALAGAALVVLADAGVKALRLPSGRLPIGVVTALIGGPVFIAMLRAQVRRPQ